MIVTSPPVLSIDQQLCCMYITQIFVDIEEGSKTTVAKLLKDLEERGILLMAGGSSRSVFFA